MHITCLYCMCLIIGFTNTVISLQRYIKSQRAMQHIITIYAGKSQEGVGRSDSLPSTNTGHLILLVVILHTVVLFASQNYNITS